MRKLLSLIRSVVHGRRRTALRSLFPPVLWQRSFVTELLLEFPLLLWRRRPGRGGRLYRNLSVTILAAAGLCLPTTLWAATFTAGLSRDTVTLGETVTLSLTFAGGTPQSVPAPPEI